MSLTGCAIVLFAGLSACGDDTDVCSAQADAAKACSFLPAPLDADTCSQNLKACADGDLTKWADHFQCMQDHCNAGEARIVVEQACAMATSSVPSGCSPGDAGTSPQH